MRVVANYQSNRCKRGAPETSSDSVTVYPSSAPKKQAAENGQSTPSSLLYQKTLKEYKARLNPEITFQFFQKCVSQGNLDAMCSLGQCYMKGFGVEKNEEKATEWYQKAASLEHPRATFHLARYYQVASQRGNQDAAKKAISTLLKAALDLEDPRAQYVLARNLFQMAAKQDYPLAIKVYNCIRKQVHKNQAIPAEIKSKVIRVKTEKSSEEIKRIEEEAFLGDPKASYELGYHYLKFKKINEVDRETIHKIGHQYLLQSAQSNSDGMYAIGKCYLKGNYYVEKDTRRAYEWFNKAAERDHPRATFQKGNCLLHGIGVEQDINEAKQVLRKAALELNDLKAQYFLAFYLLQQSAENEYRHASSALKKI